MAPAKFLHHHSLASRPTSLLSFGNAFYQKCQSIPDYRLKENNIQDYPYISIQVCALNNSFLCCNPAHISQVFFRVPNRRKPFSSPVLEVVVYIVPYCTCAHTAYNHCGVPEKARRLPHPPRNHPGKFPTVTLTATSVISSQ